MAKYHVKCTGPLKQPGNIRKLTVELPHNVDVQGLIDYLLDDTDTLGRREDYTGAHPSEAFRILVNGRNIRVLDCEHTMLDDGDNIAILVPIAGGVAI